MTKLRLIKVHHLNDMPSACNIALLLNIDLTVFVGSLKYVKNELLKAIKTCIPLYNRYAC